MTITNLNILYPNTLADVVPLNENFETLRLNFNSSESNIGDLRVLNTGNKNSIVAAINDAIESMNALVRVAVPAGTILAFAGIVAPNSYILCDGAAVSRTMYNELFDAIGTIYGAGDGATTFNLPDLRGRFLRGYLQNTSAEIGTAQEDAVPNITGTFGHGGWKEGQYRKVTGCFTTPNTADSTIGNQTQSGTYPGFGFDASLSNPVYGAADEVRPKNLAINYCIKY